MHYPSCFASANRLRSWFTVSALVLAASFATASQVLAQGAFVLDPTPNLKVRDRAYIINSLSGLSDGRILLSGLFHYADDIPVGSRSGAVVTLDSDGALASELLVPGVEGSIQFYQETSDGKILIAGAFTAVAGVARPGLARLNADGTLDESFAPVAPGFEPVRGIAPLSDGGLLCLGASFVPTFQSQVRRYDSFGQLVAGYTNPSVPGISSAWAAGPNGEVALIGYFSSGLQQVAVFSGTGALSSMTAAKPADFQPFGAVFDPDGSLVLTGQTFPGSGPSLIRIRSDGVLDPLFDGYIPSSSGGVRVIRLADGRYVVLPVYSIPGPAVVFHCSANGVFEGAYIVDDFPGSYPINIALHNLPGSSDYLVSGRIAHVNGILSPTIARVSGDRVVRQDFHVDLQTRGLVRSLPEYAGGRLLSGSFSEINEAFVSNLAGLTATDLLDTALPFIANPNLAAYSTSDAGAIIVGSFPPLAGTGTTGLAKLRADKTVDTTFLSGVTMFGFNTVLSLADGSTMVGGTFGNGVSSPPAMHLMRVSPSGSIDPTFTPPVLSGSFPGISAIARDTAGRFVVAGNFASYQGVARPALARISADGVLDPTFVPTVGLKANPAAAQLSVHPSGPIYALGIRGDSASFVSGLLRFNSDGSLDEGFVPAAFGADGLGSFAFAPDGSLYVAAYDGPLLNATNARVLHITTAGVLDPDFELSLDTAPSVLTLDAQGRLWLGGMFTEVNGVRREGIARLSPAEFAVEIAGPDVITVPMLGTLELQAVVTNPPGAVAYRWKRNGRVIRGEHGATLRLKRVTPRDTGRYTVTVFSEGNCLTSETVRVTVAPGRPGSERP